MSIKDQMIEQLASANGGPLSARKLGYRTGSMAESISRTARRHPNVFVIEDDGISLVSFENGGLSMEQAKRTYPKGKWVRLYSGESFAVETNHEIAKDFMVDAARALSETLLFNPNERETLIREWLPLINDAACKLRGYSVGGVHIEQRMIAGPPSVRALACEADSSDPELNAGRPIIDANIHDDDDEKVA